jgi:glyoxylase-like metal-dependent hydrolase (beta-lactamase superfamily II)
MILRPFLYEETACASYVFGCLTKSTLAVVDPHAELVERYLETADRAGAPIAAVFETHVQADHVSGLPALVEATGATAYLPAGAEVEFSHTPLRDGEVVELGNTVVRALAHSDADSFARALLVDVPPPPADQAAIVAANLRGLLPTRT